jgi:hypothetical protein
VHICTAGCQPLLRALRFAQHNSMFQQADCIHSLVSILATTIQYATHCCLTESTVCAICMFAEPQTVCPKMPMSIIMTCSNMAYIISHINSGFLDCLMGGLPSLDTFSRFTCPLIILHRLAFGETCTFVHPVHNHPCCNCSEILPGSSFHWLLLNMQTELVFSYSGKIGVCFMYCSWTCQTCPIPHFTHGDATAVYLDFCHVLIQNMPVSGHLLEAGAPLCLGNMSW